MNEKFLSAIVRKVDRFGTTEAQKEVLGDHRQEVEPMIQLPLQSCSPQCALWSSRWGDVGFPRFPGQSLASYLPDSWVLWWMRETPTSGSVAPSSWHVGSGWRVELDEILCRMLSQPLFCILLGECQNKGLVLSGCHLGFYTMSMTARSCSI